MQFLCALAAQLVDQPGTTISSATSSEIHYQKPQPTGFSKLDDQSFCQPVTRQEKPL